jgi:hypothetical protein
MMSPAVRAWLTHLYPRSWRDRYAVEFDAMLEQCLHSPLDVVDVMLGALDAHLQLLNGENVNWRLMNMLNKLRTTILIVFAAYIGFIVAGMVLVGMLDDSPMIPFMKTDLPSSLAMTIIRIGAVVGLLAIIIGGLPLAITVIRRALTVDRSALGFLMVPVFSFLALVLYVGFMLLIGTGRVRIDGVVLAVQPDNFPLGNKLLIAGLLLVFILGAIVSTLAVWKVISHTNIEHEKYQVAGSEINIDIYKFAYTPAVIATISMAIILAATLIWSWLVFSSLPQVLAGNYALLLTSTQAWIYGIIALMVICTAAAVLGVVRGRSALAHD